MDADLLFLNSCTNDELLILVDIMKEKLSCTLSDNEMIYPANHVAEIADEFCRFGGNTIANILRFGDGVSYREILTDVCKDLKVPFNENHSIEHIEKNLLETTLENAWEKMSNAEKEQFLREAGYAGSVDKGGVIGLTLTQIAKLTGFKFYQGAVMVASMVAKQFGTALPMAFYVGMTTAMKTALNFLGPIMWAWTIIDIASPSKKVTVPGCLYIAALRAIKNQAE